MKRDDIKRRERDAIIQALRTGVVPILGLQHIQVGRTREIEEMIRDIDRVTDGGSSIRFIIGEFGSGKTFFLNLVRLVALKMGVVVMSAGLAPNRRLHASDGQARSLFSELTHNTAIRTKPEGGALESVIERFISQAVAESDEQGTDIDSIIRNKLSRLQELVGGYEFATVIARYWEGHLDGEEELKSNALRWLRAEFASSTDARGALGVRTIIDDESVYDHLKLFSAFVCEAGYKGLIVILDEMVNLYKLGSRQARNSNYEQILHMLNDVLQGGVSHLGILMSGTPDFLLDTRRGLYSYEALQTRLAQNPFAHKCYFDLSGPVLRLQNLTPEDLLALLINIRRVFAEDDDGKRSIPDEALQAFLAHCFARIGDACFRTPRRTVTEFVNLLSVIEQNPGADWSQLLEAIRLCPDDDDGITNTGNRNGETLSSPSSISRNDGLTSFKL